MNSASRIQALLRQTGGVGRPPAAPIGQTFGEVFAIESAASHHDREDQMMVSLQAVRREIDLTVTQLEERGLPGDLFHPQLTGLKQLLSVGGMAQQWQHGPLQIVESPELRVILGWSAYLLPEDEDAIADAELAELEAEIASFEGALESSQLPSHTRAFLKKQLSLMRRALRLYKVTGAKGIHEAGEAVLGATHRNKAAIAAEFQAAPAQERELIVGTMKVLEKITHRADVANKAWDAASMLAGHLKHGWDAISGLLS